MKKTTHQCPDCRQ